MDMWTLHIGYGLLDFFPLQMWATGKKRKKKNKLKSHRLYGR